MEKETEKSNSIKDKFNNNINRKVDDIIKFTNINRAIILFFVILAIFQLIIYLNNKYYYLPGNISNIIKLIIFIALAFFLSSVFIRFTSKIFIGFLSKEDNIEQILFLQKFYSFVIYLIAFSAVLIKLGFSLNNLSVILGLATTGFAFAIREVILSYIIWFMLLTKKPFRIGDYIKIGDEEGKVQHIGTFYVLLDNTPTHRDDFIRVPNRTFIEKPIINFGRENVLDKVNLYLKSIPKNFEVISKKLEKEFLNYNCKVFLNSDKDGIFMTIVFRSDYLERKDIITKILLKIKELGIELK
ncbi:MAG: mechanosensitive ion channel [Candidatus Woesearchaeota archaeon]